MKNGILFNDTSNEHHIGCDTVIRNIRYLCKLNGIKITRTFTRRDVKVPGKCEGAIQKCDIVIVNGEGSLHDQYGRNFLIPLLKMIPQGKKAVLVNSVWHNMGEIKDLDKFELIALRESNSLESFRKDSMQNIAPTKVLVVPDVIFYTPDIPRDITIGYGDSVYGNKASQLANGGSNYFPLDYRRPNAFKYPSNLATNDVYDYMKWLKSLDLHVTGRFHGVCLSAMTGTPFLALPSNAKKIEGILKDMHCSDLLINSVDEVENKKEIAIDKAHYGYDYAIKAKKNIGKLFRIVGVIASEA